MVTRTARQRQSHLAFTALLDEHTRQTTVIVLSDSRAFHRDLGYQLSGWNVKVTANPVEFGILIGLCQPAVVVVDRDVTVNGKPHEGILDPIEWYEIASRIIVVDRPGQRLNRERCDFVHTPAAGTDGTAELAALIQKAAATPP